jgi:hypothetical protein
MKPKVFDNNTTTIVISDSGIRLYVGQAEVDLDSPELAYDGVKLTIVTKNYTEREILVRNLQGINFIEAI